jgi:hypothetical protein
MQRPSRLSIALVGPPRSGKTMFASLLKNMHVAGKPYEPTPHASCSLVSVQAARWGSTGLPCDEDEWTCVVKLVEVPMTTAPDDESLIMASADAAILFVGG